MNKGKKRYYLVEGRNSNDLYAYWPERETALGFDIPGYPEDKQNSDSQPWERLTGISGPWEERESLSYITIQ